MTKKSFTREQVIDEAVKRYKKAICIDQMDNALEESTLRDAVTMILLDSAMWDSPTGDPMDTTHIVNLPWDDEVQSREDQIFTTLRDPMLHAIKTGKTKAVDLRILFRLQAHMRKLDFYESDFTHFMDRLVQENYLTAPRLNRSWTIKELTS